MPMMDWGGMLVMMIFWVLLIGLAVYGVVVIITKGFGKKENTSLRILEERFARGEIDADEYQQRKEVLEKK
ncbi:putative membrane protein [Desmospora profundinema]|uniref:Membrane protein n=2 Tax=Desmospora profundinema TaxID=1571184 RepID=A0ABU1IGX9_9BACL|nr:putative membrane protein [Desmospora profundinema]